MNFSREQLETDAASSGFRPETLEKVAYLLAILEGINRHPFLKGKLALKGGTALNLFLADVPRLSVDIDLNYIGAEERSVMVAERPGIEQAIKAVCEREGLAVGRVSPDHAGGSMTLRYKSVYGNTDHIKIDLIYMYRIPLWPAKTLDSHTIGSFNAHDVLVLDEYELAAGKLCALLARHTSRDLFDAHHILTNHPLNRERLRLGFVVYGGMNRNDWRKATIEGIDASAQDAETQLVPLLRQALLPDPFVCEQWVGDLLIGCKKALESVLPLEDHEQTFLNRLLDDGEIEPQHLTDNTILQGNIRRHPSLVWKVDNVRAYRGITQSDGK